MSTEGRVVLGIIGPPAAGKGTIAAYLEQSHGAGKLRFSDTLHAILTRLHVEQTRDNLIVLSEVIRERCGEDVLARAMMIGVEKSPQPIVVIDGVRREGDIALFRTMPNFHLLAVTAEAEARYERSKARAEKPEESTQKLEDFMALENRSTEVSARELMSQAEITIDNNGSLEELYRHVDEYLRSLDVQS
jgi:dephospho-CoA kinase